MKRCRVSDLIAPSVKKIISDGEEKGEEDCVGEVERKGKSIGSFRRCSFQVVGRRCVLFVPTEGTGGISILYGVGTRWSERTPAVHWGCFSPARTEKEKIEEEKR